MSETTYAIVMCFVVAWPLLLAIPTLRSRIPWPRHLAILPAVVLTVLPGDAYLDPPWLLLGSGFAVDSDVRWILAMSVAVWLTAATVANSPRRDPAGDRTTTYFLLTLAGNLGAVLATDVVGFFSFTTLMGYGFYGLLIQGGDHALRRAGRLYIVVLVVADLLLFEALLLAGFTTEDLRYAVVRQAMAGSPSAQLYFWMAFAAFALKAGIWPFHLWLLGAFKSAPLEKTLLLVGVPVAMGLLGTVRFLPLGEPAFQGPSAVIQIMGLAAFLYALVRMLMHAGPKILPAWLTVAATGLFVVALGTGLAQPVVWRQYEYLTHPVIAALGILLTALTFALARLPDTGQYPDSALERMEALSRWAQRWIGTGQRWLKDRLGDLKSFWRSSWLTWLKQYQRVSNWQKAAVVTSGWSAAITLFVLLGLALAWLAG